MSSVSGIGEFCQQILALREDLTKPGYEQIKSRRALAISQDNQLTICGSDIIYIMDLIASNDLSSDKNVLAYNMYTTKPKLSDQNSFSFTNILNAHKSLHHISEDERQALILDQCLYSYKDQCQVTLMEDFFIRALITPSARDSCHRPLLAGLTHNSRIILFTEKQQEWEMVAELSGSLKQQMTSKYEIPVVIGKTLTFDEYSYLCYSMSTVAILWSHAFIPTFKGHLPFYLFFTGTRSGGIHVWQVPLNIQKESDFQFLTTHSGTHEVSSMAWHCSDNTSGLLAVGQYDGSLYVLKVDCDLDTGELSLTEIFADWRKDDIIVTSVEWSVLDNDTLALLACKEFHILLYQCKHNCGNPLISFCQHQRLDCSLGIVDLSMHQGQGVAASMDSRMYIVTCPREDGQLKLCVAPHPPLTLVLYNQVEYKCYGCVLTSNGMCCLSVHRPKRNFAKNSKRLFIDSWKVAATTPFPFSPSLVSGCLGDLRPSGDAGGFMVGRASVQDVLIRQRLHYRELSEASIFQSLQDNFAAVRGCTNIPVLQVLRNIIIFMAQYYSQRKLLTEEHQWAQTSEESVSGEIFARHVQECFSRLSPAPSRTDLEVLRAMSVWAGQNHVPGMLVKLTSLHPEVKDIQPELCAVCQGELLPRSRLTMACDKGHAVTLCSVSLLPCHGLCIRHCDLCAHPALDGARLADCSVIPTVATCTLCGGRLRKKFS